MVAGQSDFESLYRQALEQRETRLGKASLKTIESARDLGLYLAGRGNFVTAGLYLDAALSASNTLEAATVLHNWGVAVEDPAVAEKLYRRALEIRMRALPATDIELATTRLNLAELSMARGAQGVGALGFAALAAFEKGLGAFDARTGAACGVVGAVLATRGDVVGAERMFRRALTIAEKAHGVGAAKTAGALENLADLLAQTGRESAARPLLERAQKIRSATGSR